MKVSLKRELTEETLPHSTQENFLNTLFKSLSLSPELPHYSFPLTISILSFSPASADLSHLPDLGPCLSLVNKRKLFILKKCPAVALSSEIKAQKWIERRISLKRLQREACGHCRNALQVDFGQNLPLNLDICVPPLED